METGKVVKDGPAAELLADQDIQEFYLGMGEDGPALSSTTSRATGARSGGRRERRRIEAGEVPAEAQRALLDVSDVSCASAA